MKFSPLLKHFALIFASISTALIPAVSYANWSIRGLDIFPIALNNSGQVLGSSNGDYFITGPNGSGITKFETLGESHTIVSDINDLGQVVGSSEPANGLFHQAFISGPNGVGITYLDSRGYGSDAAAINNLGQVAGEYYTPDEIIIIRDNPFITSPNGVDMKDIDVSYWSGDVSAINDSGQMVGSTVGPAFITGPNGMGVTWLDTLGGYHSAANDINDSGQVVGYSFTYHGLWFERHAFITGSDGVGMTDLGTLGGNNSEAMGINDLGEVVGVAFAKDPYEQHSFIFSHGGITDLSLLDAAVSSGWTNLEVIDINNNGQIIGSGSLDGVQQGFLLSYTPDTIFTPIPIFIPPPIPEPENYLMLLTGLGFIGFFARRKKVVECNTDKIPEHAPA